MEYYHASFRELCEKFMKKEVFNKKYECVKTSMKAFWLWTKEQNIDINVLFWHICALMDKKLPKISALYVIGSSNAGKTVMINDPLHVLARFVGTITGTTASTPFAFHECKNKRLICIDEALFAPEAVEKLKNLAGGEPTFVEVKHKSPIVIPRTPLVLTANQPPWECAKNQMVR